MAVLVLRFSGPMQAWGDSSRFTRRLTRHEPTKSGVVGLLAAAQGRYREESVEDLAQLELAVRIDQPGKIIRDFQTERSEKRGVLPLSHRFYLSDAKFLVGLAGPVAILRDLRDALLSPRWPLFLGRRSCPPDQPVFMSLREDAADVREVLAGQPWCASDRYKARHKGDELELVCDGRDGELCESQADYPLSFSLTGRRYACRPVVRLRVANPDGLDAKSTDTRRGDLPDHDPMSVL